MSKRLRGIILLAAGIALLFFGAAGAFNLFENNQSPAYSGEVVPRDMIETGYALDENGTTPQAGDQGFVPLYMPVEATPAVLPTLEAASTEEVEQAKELAQAPTHLPEEFETYRQGYQQSLQEPEDTGAIPIWIYIPSIALEAPILPAVTLTVEVVEDGVTTELTQWEAPNEFAVGWHSESARLGKLGNTVLNGHHNAFGRVFRNLAYVQEGDLVQVYGDDGNWYTYAVANKMVLPEWGVTLQRRIENAAWIMPSQDERLTLITCWPEQSNSHRLILVARPVHW